MRGDPDAHDARSVLVCVGEDYVRTARAKGVGRVGVALTRHALANALAPVVTILGLQFGALLGGTVITETIFARPGVGRLTVEGIKHATTVLQGCILAIAAGCRGQHARRHRQCRARPAHAAGAMNAIRRMRLAAALLLAPRARRRRGSVDRAGEPSRQDLAATWRASRGRILSGRTSSGRDILSQGCTARRAGVACGRAHDGRGVARDRRRARRRRGLRRRLARRSPHAHRRRAAGVSWAPARDRAHGCARRERAERRIKSRLCDRVDGLRWRPARGEAHRVRRREFVEVAVALGARASRILLRHIAPLLTGPLLVQATFGMTVAIGA
jgi:hypothetical protein